MFVSLTKSTQHVDHEFLQFTELLQLLGIIWDDQYFGAQYHDNNFVPTITIYGENHIRSNCVDKKMDMIEKAKKGEFILCLEGLAFYPSWNHSIDDVESCSIAYINGIEYSVAHLTCLALLKRIELLNKVHNGDMGMDRNIEYYWPKNILFEIKTKYFETFKTKYIYTGSIAYRTVNEVFDAMHVHLSDPSEFEYRSRPFKFFFMDEIQQVTVTYGKFITDRVLKVVNDLIIYIGSESTKKEKDISSNNLIATNIHIIKKFAELFNIFLMNHRSLKLNKNDVDRYKSLIDDPVNRCREYGDIGVNLMNTLSVQNIMQESDFVVDGYRDMNARGYNQPPCWMNVYGRNIEYNPLEIFLDNFAIKYRDPFMAKSITQCYLKAVDYRKNLKVIVGDTHASMDSKLLHLLDKKLKKLKYAKSIKIVRMEEHCPRNTDKRNFKQQKSTNQQITTALVSYLQLNY